MSSPTRLGVVCCHFNPCHYRARLENCLEFHHRLSGSPIHLLTVELAFGDEPFEIPDLGTEVVRFRSRSVLWQKERLLNWGLRQLRERGFDRLCYLDADVVFSSPDWADHVLDGLESHNLVQVFETATRYSRTLPGAARQLHDEPPAVAERRFGLGWGLRAELLERTELYEGLVAGGADRLMFLTALQHPRWAALHTYARRKLDEMLAAWGRPVASDVLGWSSSWTDAVGGRIGFAANEVTALPHGLRSDRGYRRRRELLGRTGFDPSAHLDRTGVAFEWRGAPAALRAGIADYFRLRREDRQAIPE